MTITTVYKDYKINYVTGKYVGQSYWTVEGMAYRFADLISAMVEVDTTVKIQELLNYTKLEKIISKLG